VPRAPEWLRWWGAEWLFVLWNQPHKARRYLLGNPLFLARVLGEWWPRAFLARGKPQYRSR